MNKIRFSYRHKLDKFAFPTAICFAASTLKRVPNTEILQLRHWDNSILMISSNRNAKVDLTILFILSK